MYYTLNRQRFGVLRDFIDAVGDREDRTNGQLGGHEMTTVDKERIKKAVSERYSAKAREHLKPQLLEIPLTDVSACCGPSVGTVRQAVEKAVAKGYSADELASLPETVTEMSLGCGNPLTLAQIKEGDVVLDLGSGGGLDCFLAAQRAGATGRVIGLDMNQDMLALARKNAEKAGVTNVEFREGEMESMPLPDASVDLIISNCVINLSPDKDSVFREAFRVLRPGGRLCVSDIVVEGEMPEEVRNNLDEWASCAAGALERGEFIAKLEVAGFRGAQMLSENLSRRGVEMKENGWDKGQLLSAVIMAVKP